LVVAVCGYFKELLKAAKQNCAIIALLYFGLGSVVGFSCDLSVVLFDCVIAITNHIPWIIQLILLFLGLERSGKAVFFYSFG
jgi:hypothetical protein